MGQYKRSIIITGGAGFIGSHVVRLFVNKYPEYRIINVDKLTYAGNLANLKDIEDRPNYRFVKADICDFDAMLALSQEKQMPFCPLQLPNRECADVILTLFGFTPISFA